MSEVIEHPKAREQRAFGRRFDSLREEFITFCIAFHPEAVIDERTSDLAAVFVAFKLDGGEEWVA